MIVVDLDSDRTTILLLPDGWRLKGQPASSVDDMAARFAEQMYEPGSYDLVPGDHEAMAGVVDLACVRTAMLAGAMPDRIGATSIRYSMGGTVHTRHVRVIVLHDNFVSKLGGGFIRYDQPEAHGFEIGPSHVDDA